MKTKKDILYILDPSKDITGAFVCARNEALLIKDSFEVVLVLPSVSKIDHAELQIFSKVIQLPIYDIRKSLFSMLIYFPTLLVSGWKLKQAMKKDKCTLLQVNDYYMMQGVVARLFGFRGKIVTWVRIDPTRYGSFFSKYWLKYAYWASDTVVSVSEFIFQRLPTSSKNRLVYDPANNDLYPLVQAREEKKRKLIYIGNYIEGKGQQHAIVAFEKIAKEFPDVELHFYGGVIGLEKNRLYKQNLQELAINTAFGHRIVFHDFVQDTRSVLEQGYMALNFSESESFSMTCLEASTVGLSVIATRCGGPEEIIVDGKTGFLVNKGDIEAMAEAMTKLLLDKEKNRLFGKNAALYVREKFSEKSFKEQIKDIFLGDIK